MTALSVPYLPSFLSRFPVLDLSGLAVGLNGGKGRNWSSFPMSQVDGRWILLLFLPLQWFDHSGLI